MLTAVWSPLSFKVVLRGVVSAAAQPTGRWIDVAGGYQVRRDENIGPVH